MIKWYVSRVHPDNSDNRSGKFECVCVYVRESQCQTAVRLGLHLYIHAIKLF